MDLLEQGLVHHPPHHWWCSRIGIPRTIEQRQRFLQCFLDLGDVYGLRAELIAREAARDDPEHVEAFEEAAAGALWYLARLLSRLDTYMERYGRSILHGAAEYDANALIRLAGWTGEVTKEEARDLRFALARAGEWDREGFIASTRE